VAVQQHQLGLHNKATHACDIQKQTPYSAAETSTLKFNMDVESASPARSCQQQQQNCCRCSCPKQHSATAGLQTFNRADYKQQHQDSSPRPFHHLHMSALQLTALLSSQAMTQS
jgi:hypothetical protein